MYEYTAYTTDMKIIEKFIASKYGDDTLCEDGLFINDKFIAVMDGVTAKGKLLWDSKTSGFRTKEVLINAMAQLNGSEDAVILASDGYPRLEPSLSESELFLEELKVKDPLCIDIHKAVNGFTNGKSSIDDRTYIKFVI